MKKYPTVSESIKITEKFYSNNKIDPIKYLKDNGLDPDPVDMGGSYQINIWGMTLEYPTPEYQKLEDASNVSIAVALMYLDPKLNSEEFQDDTDEFSD
jgi:hypothetical protein